MEKNQEHAVLVKNLTKRFGSFTALDGLSLEIEKGQIYGLIGPNGSGKTTAIQCILGLYRFEPTSQINVLGWKIPEDRSRLYQEIGYMPQQIALYQDLSVEQNLRFFGRLKRIPRKRLFQRIDELLERVDLTEFRTRVISKSSGGMKRRASLAAALLSEPKLLILDEPTVGIDPSLRVEFWEYFRQLTDENEVTVLITTHYLGESVRCDQIGLLQKKLIMQGKPKELQEMTQQALNLQELANMDQVFIHFTQTKPILEEGK